MSRITRRQFGTATVLTGMGVLLLPREFGAQSGSPTGQNITTGELLVSIPVNNVPTTFLIDSSSPQSFITPATASGLGLVANGQATVSIPGAGPTFDSQMYGATLGGDSGSSFPFQVAGVDDVNQFASIDPSSGAVGILGADFLSQFSSISISGSTLTGTLGNSSSPSPSPTPPPAPSPTPSSSPVPKTGAAGVVNAGHTALAQQAALPPPFTVTYPVINIRGQLFAIVTIIDGTGARRQVLFLIDTGAQITMLNTQQALNLGLLPLMIGPAPMIPWVIPIQGVGGGAVAPLTPVNLPGLGTFPVAIGNLPLPNVVAGILGTDVLGNSFQLTINGRRGTLTITTKLGQIVQLIISIAQAIIDAFKAAAAGG
jgi:hypothetical protein